MDKSGSIQKEAGMFIDAVQNKDYASLVGYIGNNHDASDDFWKVILDENGRVQNVLDDGDKKTITFVDETGKVQSINIAKGSLTGQIANLAASFQTGDDKQDKSDINQVMIDSGLWYKDGIGWYATNAGAIDYGSGYDPVYEAIRNGNYGNLPDILSHLNQNSQTDISQEMIEQDLGLTEHSACAISSTAEMSNNFLQSEYGISLDSSELLEAIKNGQGEMFDESSTVQSFNGINALIAAALGIDNYPVFSGYYNSVEALQAGGIEYYLQKFIDVDDSEHTHFGSWSNGVLDDPDTTTGRRWWTEDKSYNSLYYGFTPKH